MKKRGFTLLEIVVSILVLMLGVGLIMYIFPAALDYLSRSKNVTVATFLAQSKMEELKSYGANIPNSQFGEYAAPDNPNFMYKVEKLSLWSGYKEIKVSVSKPARTSRGQMIAQVYATVSGIQESPTIADVATYYYQSSVYSPQEARLYYFCVDRKNKTIQFVKEYIGQYGIVNENISRQQPYALTSWEPLKYGQSGTIAVIPDNGIPEKVWIEAMPINQLQVYPSVRLIIFVSDSVNNCVWRQYFTVISGGGWMVSVQDRFEGNWVKLPRPLP